MRVRLITITTKKNRLARIIICVCNNRAAIIIVVYYKYAQYKRTRVGTYWVRDKLIVKKNS